MIYCFAAALISASLMLALMPMFIPYLKKLKFGQTIYDLGPKAHKAKQGTPNMGGIIIAGTTGIAFLAACVLLQLRAAGNAGIFDFSGGVWALLFVCFGAMIIGFADDYIKDIKKNHEGLKPMQKIAGQLTVGLLFSLWAYRYVGSDVILPFTQKTWDLGLFYIPLITLTVLFMTNSANLQDGADGLLSSVTWIGMAAFGVIGYRFAIQGESVPRMAAAAMLSFALAGACIGFLRFNRHPAKIFMGDTGSMFIGGAMVGVAVLTKCEFLLLPICFTCVMSSVSVILQRYYFKLTHGKRIFKMSPIHHHFELCGMSENQIVLMYSAVTLALSFAALFSVFSLLW